MITFYTRYILISLYLIEIRTKGVGFYRFSKVEEERQEQMRALKQLRLEVCN
jgi:hypothetical protein